MERTSEYIISPDEFLLRRIPLVPSHISQGRITSAGFKTHSDEDGLSVDIEKLVKDISQQFNSNTETIARILAEIPMNLGYSCKHDPIEGNSAHALIVGNTKPIAKKLAMLCIAYDEEILKKF